MSAFLGPIHYWLYKKIQLQEEMLRSAVICGEKNGWAELTEELKERCVSEEIRPLEELIDTANIHGWLQERIHDAESRYATLITKLLSGGSSRISELRDCMYELGSSHGLSRGGDARDAYQLFEDSLLNGMPCDRVNVVLEQDTDKCTWQLTSDIHGEYWIAAGGDAAVYYELRRAFMEGALSASGLKLSIDDEYRYTVAAV